MRLVEQAHEALRAFLKAGDIVIDATVGNGYDTTFLAQQVGPSGSVYGFDIQPLALEVAGMVLKTRKCDAWCFLKLASHENMLELIPKKHQGKIAAAMFNLGYLPHGDKALVTQPESTARALDACLQLLKNEGVISILSYRGHPGGMDEFKRVQTWIGTHEDEVRILIQQNSKHPESVGPFLWLLQKQ